MSGGDSRVNYFSSQYVNRRDRVSGGYQCVCVCVCGGGGRGVAAGKKCFKVDIKTLCLLHSMLISVGIANQRLSDITHFQQCNLCFRYKWLQEKHRFNIAAVI